MSPDEATLSSSGVPRHDEGPWHGAICTAGTTAGSDIWDAIGFINGLATTASLLGRYLPNSPLHQVGPLAQSRTCQSLPLRFPSSHPKVTKDSRPPADSPETKRLDGDLFLSRRLLTSAGGRARARRSDFWSRGWAWQFHAHHHHHLNRVFGTVDQRHLGRERAKRPIGRVVVGSILCAEKLQAGSC